MANSVILLDTYRAISSAPFLWLACTDPLLAAFNLVIDLQVCEEMENENKFLSSLGVQAAMEDHWRGMWTDMGKFKYQDLSRKFRHFLCYPILALLHAISAGYCIKTFKYPLARFDLILIWLFSGSFFCFVMTAATISQDGLKQLHRRHWVYYDFSIIYDIYFGAASIMALWRILYYFQLQRFIGSTIISISKCIRDVMIFLSIAAIIMICFSLGINTMYQAYNENRVLDKDGNIVKQKETYSSIGITFRNLYWSFYGYLAPWDYKLIVGNAGPNQEPTEHPLTNYAGEITIATFHVAVVVTLLNLMISMLVRTADTVQKNEDMEWKFTRCQIYAEYFEWFTAIPPPFNLIYNTTYGLYRAFSNEFKFVYPDLWIPIKIWKPSLNDVIAQDLLYLKLLRVLFERYRFAEEYHYQTVMKNDADRFIDKEKYVC